jgi:hypothetical protein
LNPQVEPFRRRNPRTTATLTSPYAPAVGASLAGLALGVYPSAQLRVSLAILAMFRALEFGWNMCEGEGLIWGVKAGRLRERPWWFGSWMLQPLALGQLFHASIFDPECAPAVSRPAKHAGSDTDRRRYLRTSCTAILQPTCTVGLLIGQPTSNGPAPLRYWRISLKWRS